MTKEYKTGLVLSGGGTRGFAHLGVIAALFEKGLKPDVISGVSAGAIVGAFIAAGKQPEEILKIFKKGWFFQYTKLHMPIDGLLKLDGLKEIIQKEITTENIEDLKIPFYVGLANLNEGSMEYKNSGNIGQTVLASSSIPILFAPVKIEDKMYVDGGLMDNIPIHPIKNSCEKIIVSNVISPINKSGKIKNLIQIAIRSFYMNVNTNRIEALKKASLFIEPEGIEKYDILLRSHADELFELGYNAAKNALTKSIG